MLHQLMTATSWLQEPTGPEGAQQIFSYALGLLDAIDVLSWVKAVIYLVLVLFSTKLIFSVLRGGG